MAELPWPKVAKTRSTSLVSSRIPSAAIPRKSSALSTSPASSHASKTVITRSHCWLSSSLSRLSWPPWSMLSCPSLDRDHQRACYRFVSLRMGSRGKTCTSVFFAWLRNLSVLCTPQDKFLAGSSVVTTCCLSQQHALDGARTAACSHSTALPCLHALTPSSDWQVKEGHDSTVRPKMLVFEFDGGRKYIDEWAADGKPSLTRAQMRRVQSWKILAAVIVPPILLMIDYGHGETFTSPFQRRFGRWWHHFCALDSVDVAKAYSGGWRPDPSIDPATKFSRYL